MADNELRLLLVTQHILFGECLATGLTEHFPEVCVETVNDTAQAESHVTQTNPELVIFEVDAPDPITPDEVRRFAKQFENTPILVVGRYRQQDEIIAFIEAGAVDFRATDRESLCDFCRAIEKALRRETTHCAERTRAMFDRLRHLSVEVSRIKSIDTMPLTKRELEIMQLIDQGRSNKQIAKELHISLHTVKNHVHRILEKLDVDNRREAVYLAYRDGWLKVAKN